MSENQDPTLTVDGKEYKISDLSKEATAELASLRVAEQEMLKLQAKMAIATTARNAYRQALLNLLPKDTQ